MAEIDSSTKVLGLIGDPVSGSLSPRLQNRAIDRLGLDYRYFAFPVKEGRVNEAVIGAKELGLKGLNVTVPHKKTVVEYTDNLSRAARVMGAINTITFAEEGEIEGDNTDWKGFLKSLELHEFDPEGKRCLVFGAGGAASGVVYGLVRRGARRIVIVNRTESKGVDLARKMEGLSLGVDLDVRPLTGSDIGKRIERSDLVVNATSVGMGATEGEAVWEDGDGFHSGQLVYDLIYNPSPTKFLKLADDGGADTIDGLDMLILQGLESLKKWTGEEFESGEKVDELRRYLRDSGGLN
ncbi:shikimate dehydrogenase [Candidatus Bipolaricaulota bacterium]|nr:shikimate dehydrogenase [Candidatus Bipolaricaulota bacterium]